MNQLKRITFDPAVMGGKPCIRDMRVTVGAIIGLLASGGTETEILAARCGLRCALRFVTR